MKKHVIVCACLGLALLGCEGETAIDLGGPGDDELIDITDAVFSNTSGNCEEYVADYTADISDVVELADFTANLSISVSGGECVFSTDSLPNHDMQDGGAFATPVAEVSRSFSMTSSPSDAASETYLSLSFYNAIMLNGAVLDMLAAACYHPDQEVDSSPDATWANIGCNDPDQPWRIDPLAVEGAFGTDSHNAHTQPDGTYHYHADPNAMYDATNNTTPSPVIGFAADGYPIYGPYFNDGTTVREAVSSYRLRTGDRLAVTYVSSAPEASGITSWDPPGDYDGSYRDDYEYVAGLGDLDECNGMSVDGQYGYYLTDAFPYVLACLKGNVQSSFSK